MGVTFCLGSFRIFPYLHVKPVVSVIGLAQRLFFSCNELLLISLPVYILNYLTFVNIATICETLDNDIFLRLIC